jgi:phosphotransacetylase
MELKNFDELLALAPHPERPLRLVLAGADNDEMLKGVFRAQETGLIDPILVSKKGRVPERLEALGLTDRPHTLIEIEPGHSVAGAAIDAIRLDHGDILMRGNMLAHDFLSPLLDRNTGLRDGDRIMSHVALANLPEYPKLLALADMTVIIRPDLSRKKAIIRNTVEALSALGYERPKLALLSLVEKGTFRMQDTVEAQSLVYEQKRVPFVDADLWGPISYDLIISKEAARLKKYDCPWTGGGFDGIIAPELTTANTLLKSWLMHAHSDICGAVMGARVPIAMTSRSVSDRESLLSLAFCTILHEYYKKHK